MHSITIQDVKDKSHDHFESNKVTIELGYYERYPQMLLTTPEQKLSYIVSYLCKDSGLYKNKVKPLLKALNKFFNSNKDFSILKKKFDLSEELFSRLYDAIKLDGVKFKFTVSKDNLIYAEGYEEIGKYFKTHNFKDIIFNPDYIIVIDGDEYYKYNDVREREYNKNVVNLLDDPDEIWLNRKYDFSDELLLNNQEPKRLTFSRLYQVLFLNDLRNDYYDNKDKIRKKFKGIIYKDKLIKPIKNYVFFRGNYVNIYYGKPKLMHISENYDNEYLNIQSLYIYNKKTDEYDRYSLKDCDVKIEHVKGGFYLKFYDANLK